MYLHPSKLIVAEKDIAVIKCLNKVNWFDVNTASSPYKDFVYELGVTHQIPDHLWECSKADSKYEFAPRRSIKIGFHSFKHVVAPDAPEWHRKEWSMMINDFRCTVFKAFIPAGAEYFEGISAWGTPCYVSNKLLVTQELAP